VVQFLGRSAMMVQSLSAMFRPPYCFRGVSGKNSQPCSMDIFLMTPAMPGRVKVDILLVK